MAVTKKSGSSFNRIKNVLSRYFAHISIVLIFLIIFIAKSNVSFVEQAKATALDVMQPVINIISLPAKGFSYVSENISNLLNIRKENARLKEENKILIEWRDYAQKLEGDIERLATIAKYIQPPESTFVTAKIIADSSSPLSHTLIAIAGQDNGVKKNMIAMSESGVVGRVLYAGKSSSRILLLTDITSRLPIVVGKNKIRAMLIGTNKENPVITFLPIDAKIEIGDQITTSGIGGIFPPDLSVGVVTSVKNDEILVDLYSDKNLLTLIKIVDYKIIGLNPEAPQTEEKTEKKEIKKPTLKKNNPQKDKSSEENQ